MHYNNDDHICYFYERKIHFVEGGELNKAPSDVEYDYASGENSDHEILTENSYATVVQSILNDQPIYADTTFHGDVDFDGNDLKITDGNYIQTTTGSHVYNFSGSNSMCQQECSDKYYARYGIGCTGAKGYCILSVYGNTVKLSGDLTELRDLFAISASLKYSMSLGSGSESYKYTIASITQDLSSGTVVLNQTISLKGPSTEAEYIEQWYGDDNAFYSIERPDIGNATVPSFYGNHAEGAATKAIQRCTHAEGRNCIADIRYSHAEGSDTKALGMYSHAEGFSTTAAGSNSHADGYGAVVNADKAYGWSGTGTYTIPSTRSGTFNINPKGGTSGFYIGETSLATLLGACGKSFSDSDTADLTTNDGKTAAIKQILLLLGMKESNIKTL